MTLPVIDLPSPNFDERPGGPADIDMLILHYTGMQTGQAALDRLRDPGAKVSSHYVVEEDGRIFRLVPEPLRAFHAGVSFWRGRHTLNGVCIGIEIVNPGHEWGYRPFPTVQMAAVKNLCLDILGRHAIPPRNVVGHSDVAPNRKQDPGELFDWQSLAHAGIGAWPEDDGRMHAPNEEAARAALDAIGYDATMPLEILLLAFQRHFLPHTLSARLDEATMGRLLTVAE